MSRRFAVGPLTDWCAAVLRQAGLAAEDATVVAELIVETECRGVRTHGLIRLATYLDKLASGEYQALPRLTWQHRPGVLDLDAGDAMGQLAGARAIDRLCALAETEGSVMCFGTRLGHLGAVGSYPLRAARRGFFAVAMQRTPPMMGLPGYRGPVIGNSPLAWACPVPGRPPLVFDMACSVAARGHVLRARQRGEPIEPGWALDADGQPTTDADAAARGMLLPSGGHKGLGLAMLVECLAGSLAARTGKPRPVQAQDLGAGAKGGQNAFFWIINPALAGDAGAFGLDVSAWTQLVREQGGPQARLPGERAARLEAEQRRDGLTLDTVVTDALRVIAERSGIALP